LPWTELPGKKSDRPAVRSAAFAPRTSRG